MRIKRIRLSYVKLLLRGQVFFTVWRIWKVLQMIIWLFASFDELFCISTFTHYVIIIFMLHLWNEMIFVNFCIERCYDKSTSTLIGVRGLSNLFVYRPCKCQDFSLARLKIWQISSDSLIILCMENLIVLMSNLDDIVFTVLNCPELVSQFEVCWLPVAVIKT